MDDRPNPYLKAFFERLETHLVRNTEHRLHTDAGDVNLHLFTLELVTKFISDEARKFPEFDHLADMLQDAVVEAGKEWGT